MTVGEAQMAAEIVNKAVSERTRIIWGCSIEPELEGTIKILLIITGAKSKYMLDSRGLHGMSTQPAPRGGAPLYASTPQQYQQPRRNDEELDFVR